MREDLPDEGPSLELELAEIDACLGLSPLDEFWTAARTLMRVDSSLADVLSVSGAHRRARLRDAHPPTEETHVEQRN